MPEWITKLIAGVLLSGATLFGVLWVFAKHIVEKIIPGSDTFKQNVQNLIKTDTTIVSIQAELGRIKEENRTIKSDYASKLEKQIEKNAQYMSETNERLARLEEKYDGQKDQLNRIESKL